MPSDWLPLGPTGYLPGSVGDSDVRLEEANGTVGMPKLLPLAFRKGFGEVFFQFVAAPDPLALRGEKIRVGGIGLDHGFDVAPVEGRHKRIVAGELSHPRSPHYRPPAPPGLQPEG